MVSYNSPPFRPGNPRDGWPDRLEFTVVIKDADSDPTQMAEAIGRALQKAGFRVSMVLPPTWDDPES